MSKSIILGIILCAFLISCSQKENLDSVKLTISELNFKTDKSLYTNQISAPFYTDKNKVIFFNKFESSIDTLDFTSKNYLKGDQLEIEGPNSLPEFVIFYPVEQYLVFQGANTLFKSNNKLTEKESIIQKFPGKIQRYFFQPPASEFGNCIKCSENNFYILFSDSDTKKNYQLAKFHTPDSLSFLPFPDESILEKNKLGFKYGSSTLEKGTIPYATETSQGLIISFYHTSEVWILEKSKPFNYKIISGSPYFKSKKDEFPKEPISDFSKFIEVSKIWNNDISFGPIYSIPNSDNFFRLVKGPSSKNKLYDGGIFLEVLNSKLKTAYIEELTKMIPDITCEYFVLPSGIYIKKNSNDEDDLSFYRIILN
ncbi:hypothetical protein [Algoriphagus boseongensis]|uniref:hypothetical protein n=1 Tax=Algoriphagus boseongensis TaxID=1442587 RepID=UPI00105FD944|nr:hypothetical protein [Algoriphagus boseongensis]